MKRSIASVILMALTVVVVTSLLMRRAHADVILFTAQLLASNEVPPVSNADANAFGSVQITLDTVASTARFDWSVGQVAAPAIILSHIHEGAAGVNGPVRVDSGISPATSIPVVGGTASFSKSGITVPTDVRDRILANPAGFYFNIHSTLNTGGVVRGQLVRATVSGGGAPTLSEWGAILMTLLFIAACTFFLAGRSKVSAIAGSTAPALSSGLPRPIDWKLLLRVTLALEAMIALALVVLRAGPVDALGALASGVVLAFIVHMLIAAARRR